MGHKSERKRFEDATLLPLKMEEGASDGGRAPSELRNAGDQKLKKARKRILP